MDLMRISHPRFRTKGIEKPAFKWLIARGSGPEWVNPAVEPFVKEVTGWDQHLVSLRTGTVGRVFSAGSGLFIYLKAAPVTRWVKDVGADCEMRKGGVQRSGVRSWAAEDVDAAGLRIA